MKSTFIFLLFVLLKSLSAYVTPNTQVSWNMDSLVVHSGGAVTGGNGHFAFTQSVTVSSSDTLHIEAGDTLVFLDQSGNLKLEIKGSLFALGTAADSILLTSENKNYGDYAGLEFRDNPPGSVQQVWYCVVEYGKRNIKAINSSPLIEHSAVRHSGDAGIDLGGSNATIRECRIYHNRRYALKMSLSSAPLIETNMFYQNNFQNTSPYVIITIGLQGVNSPVIRGNTIQGGYEKSGGIAVWGQSNGVIEYNRIENCAYGIFCYQGGANPLIRANTLLNNNINPDTLNFGFGIACNGANAPVITGNVVQGHYYGVAIVGGAQPNVGDLSNTDTLDDGLNRFLGNGIGNNKYELYNNNPLPIKAEGNWWGTNDPDSIEARIVHQHDNPAFGPVDFQPFRTMDPLRLPAGSALLTSDFRLFGNFPNPFNPGTTLAFFLAKPLRVNLTVYDILGQSVTTLVSGRLDAGNHRVYWDGRNSIGNEVSAGIYYYQLSAGNRSQTRKMILLR